MEYPGGNMNNFLVLSAAKRFLEFFTANIRNPNTRKAVLAISSQ